MQPKDLSSRGDDDSGNNDVIIASDTQLESNRESTLDSLDTRDHEDDVNSDCEVSTESSDIGNDLEDDTNECNSNQPSVQVERNNMPVNENETGETQNNGEKKRYEFRDVYDSSVRRYVAWEKKGDNHGKSIHVGNEVSGDTDYGERAKKVTITMRDGLNTGLIPSSWIKKSETPVDINSAVGIKEICSFFQLDSQHRMLLHCSCLCSE